MTAREMILRSAFIGIALGGSIGTLSIVHLAAKTDPVIAAILGLTAFGCAFVTLMVAHGNDRNAERLLELRAVIAYALHLHEICDGGSILFLRMQRRGQPSLAEAFPSWPQFRADFIRKDGDA